MPYAKCIDLVGIGNHEQACRKHSHVDTNAALVKTLKWHGSSARLAEYAGWAIYDRGRGQNRRFCLLHWHGAGKGSGKITTVLSDLNSRSAFVEGADACWAGHFHALAVSRVSRIDGRLPQSKARSCWLIRTGSYLDGYETRSYASESLFAPMPTGNVRLVLHPDGSSRVEVR